MLKLSVIAKFFVGACALAACATDGTNGMNGADGTNGTDGTDGTNGTNGSNGSNGAQGPAGPELAPPGVYTLSNAIAGNQVATYLRGEDGNLTRDLAVATGGAGLGAGLGSQDAIVFDAKTQRFFGVNAGDNTISMLEMDGDGNLIAMSTVASGGMRPVSIAVHGDAVYVANQGNLTGATVAPNLTGFQIVGDALVPIASSTQALSATTDVHPTDLKFSPDGKVLVVAERFANKLDTFVVDNDVAQPGSFQASSGMMPFAFDFSPEGFLIVAEVGSGAANGSSVSSYALTTTGVLTPVTAALATMQTAACWLVTAGGYAYIANAGSANLTGVIVSPTGALTLHDGNGITAAAGTAPTDLAVSPDRGYLYSLASGSHTVNIFAIESDGTLTAEPALPNLPATAAGLVAR